MKYLTYDLSRIQLDNGNVPSFAFPGGYPLYYVTEDMSALCPDCVNDNRKLIDDAAKDNDTQWHIVDSTINFESYIVCDHCNKKIESAYGDSND